MFSRVQTYCGWCGIASIVLMIVGMGPLAQLAPPPSPFIGAAEVAAHFRQNATGILAGMFLVNLAVALSVALVVGISIQIRRMEPLDTPVLSYLQLASGTVASLFLMLPAMILSAAVFRADRAPELMLLVHDIATFCTFMPFSVATLECAAIALAIFADRSPKPAFPRWLGYYNVLAGISYVPMGLLGFFKDGMLASDGLFGWWVPTVLVAPWYLLMSLYLIKAEKDRTVQERGLK